MHLDHQLRAEIFSNIVYRSPATFFCIDADTRRGPIEKRRIFFRIPPFIMRRSPLLAVFCSRSIRVPFHTQIAVTAIQSNAKLVRRAAPTIFLGHCPSLGKQTPDFHDTQCYSFVKLCIKTLFTCVTHVLIKYIYTRGCLLISLFHVL